MFEIGHNSTFGITFDVANEFATLIFLKQVLFPLNDVVLRQLQPIFTYIYILGHLNPHYSQPL
jgi:hypothetical protein